MQESGQKKQKEKKVREQKIFVVPYSLEEIKTNIFFQSINSATKNPKEEIIKQAIKSHVAGNIKRSALL